MNCVSLNGERRVGEFCLKNPAFSLLMLPACKFVDCHVNSGR